MYKNKEQKPTFSGKSAFLQHLYSTFIFEGDSTTFFSGRSRSATRQCQVINRAVGRWMGNNMAGCKGCFFLLHRTHVGPKTNVTRTPCNRQWCKSQLTWDSTCRWFKEL